MKITKYAHSCLLVEDGQSILFDPGVYSWQSGSFNIEAISRLDKVIITHTHQDHYYPEFLQAVLGKFPQALVIANSEVQNQLRLDDIRFEALNSDDNIIPFEVSHPNLPWDVQTVQNTGYHIFNRLTNPGDSLDFSESNQILTLPITAPWLSHKSVIEWILSLANPPQTILPLHDWHWNDVARQNAYQISKQVLGERGINFIGLIDGQPVEI